MTPHEACRQGDANTLACVGRRHDKHVLVAIMAKDVLVPGAEDDAVAARQMESFDVGCIGPARSAIGVGVPGLAGSPERKGECHCNSDGDARKEDQPRGFENLTRIGVKVIPPQQELPRRVEADAPDQCVRRPELWLIAERIRSPLRRHDGAGEEGAQHGQDLAPVDAAGAH